MMEKVRILLVDEDQDFLNILSVCLEDVGYYVDTARDSKESVQKIREGIYDIVLISLHLLSEEESGLLSEIEEIASEMPRVFISNQVTNNRMISSDFVVKPLEIDELLRIIDYRLKQFDNEKVNAAAESDTFRTRLKRLDTNTDCKWAEVDDRRQRFTCLLCEHQFETKRLLKQHYNVEHQRNIPDFRGHTPSLVRVSEMRSVPKINRSHNFHAERDEFGENSG